MTSIDPTTFNSCTLTHPEDIASRYLFGFLSDRLEGIRWLNNANYSVPSAGEISPLLLGCQVICGSNGYQLYPRAVVRLDSLALLSPETELTTSALSCLGTWSFVVKSWDDLPGMNIIRCVISGLIVAIMFGASVVKTVSVASKLFKVNRCIRALTKQVHEQRAALLAMSTELERAYSQVTETVAWQANVETLKTFKNYRSVLITNLVEKILFFILTVSIICFAVLAVVLGVSSLGAVVMGGCALGFFASFLIFALISHFFGKKYVKQCVLHAQSAWLSIMTSKLLKNMPEELRQNYSARLILLNSFIQEQGRCCGEKAFLAAELANVMTRIGYPMHATHSGMDVDSNLMIDSLIESKKYFG